MRVLSKIEFEILSLMAAERGKRELTGDFISSKIHVPLTVVSAVLNKFSEVNLIQSNAITPEGLTVLEPYRVKRAVFLAAGFGKRLVPITLNTPKPLVRVHGIRIIDRLIDACLKAGIAEIVIVRGYLAEQFDQLLYKYPQIKFVENPLYDQANNISSALAARSLLAGAYVFEADLLLYNEKIITPYQYESNFLAIKTPHTDDWCFAVENGTIRKERQGGDDCWQMVGISYWDDKDGAQLFKDLDEVYNTRHRTDAYWEQVPLVYCKSNYNVSVRECCFSDVVEIDTFSELKAIDKNYDVQ